VILGEEGLYSPHDLVPGGMPVLTDLQVAEVSDKVRVKIGYFAPVDAHLFKGLGAGYLEIFGSGLGGAAQEVEEVALGRQP
jgi:hypothetical protein